MNILVEIVESSEEKRKPTSMPLHSNRTFVKPRIIERIPSRHTFAARFGAF